MASAELYGKSIYGDHLRRVAEGKVLYGGKLGERPVWGKDRGNF